MAMRADYIWMNGMLIPWDEAQVHVFTHALHYGSSAFEGIRVYETANGPAIFRGREHYERLLYSAKVARIPSPYGVEEYLQATIDVVRANNQRRSSKERTGISSPSPRAARRTSSPPCSPADCATEPGTGLDR